MNIVIDVLFYGLIVRAILTQDVANWMRHKGFVKEREAGYIWKGLDFIYNIVTGIRDSIKNFFVGSERRRALWDHELNHSLPLEGCAQDKCLSL